MNSKQFEALREIRKLLWEATQHSLAADGHCKSAECVVEVGYPAHSDSMEPSSLYIYSYLLCPYGRSVVYTKGHERNSRNSGIQYTGNQDVFEYALREVRQWHENEMNAEYDPLDWGEQS